MGAARRGRSLGPCGRDRVSVAWARRGCGFRVALPLLMRTILRIGVALLAIAIAAVGSPASAADPTLQIHRCGTPELLASAAQRPLASEFPALATAEKLVRDAFGVVYSQRVSTNFVVKWTDASVTQTDADNVLAVLERGWSKYITELRHLEPTGSPTYRVNAYISRATDVPAIDSAAGYASIDTDGFPYFVIHRDVLSDSLETESTTLHELYHVVQFATGAYQLRTADWYWEASAEWAAIEAAAANPNTYRLIGGLALRWDLPLYSFVDAATDYVAAAHQYGASLFLHHVTHKFPAPQVVAASWKQALSSSEPLAMIASLLPTSTSLASEFAEFAAHNTIWDYAARAAIIESIAQFKQYFPTLDEVAARVPAKGVPLTMLTRTVNGLGYANIELARPSTGWVDVEVQMTRLAPDVRLLVTFVAGRPGSATYTPLAVDGTKATGILGFPDGAMTAYVSIATMTDQRTTAVQVPISYRVTPAEQPPISIDPPNDNGGSSSGVEPVLGGCRASGGWSTWFPGIALLALFLARRRGQAQRELAL